MSICDSDKASLSVSNTAIIQHAYIFRVMTQALAGRVKEIQWCTVCKRFLQELVQFLPKPTEPFSTFALRESKKMWPFIVGFASSWKACCILCETIRGHCGFNQTCSASGSIQATCGSGSDGACTISSSAVQLWEHRSHCACKDKLLLSLMKTIWSWIVLLVKLKIRRHSHWS